MLRKYVYAVPILIAALLLIPTSASAALERVGPTAAANGYPLWYQDTTGVTLEFCSPSAEELFEGWCLLLPADMPDPNSPELFPTNFPDEHFYWAADAVGTMGASRVRLVLGLEAAFAGLAVIPGEQVTFGRLRIRLDDAPATGVYKFYTPYGIFELDGVAGDRIFATRDLGIACPVGDFSCALQSDLGPFLLPSSTAGGAEIAPVTGPGGRRYIATPTRSGPVTGSPHGVYQTSSGPRNANIFRIESPDGQVFETTNFTLVGRIYEGTLPGRVHVDRASYAASVDTNKVEAFATAFPSTPGRLPADPVPAAVIPNLALYTTPCGGEPDTTPTNPGGSSIAMSRNGSVYYAQTEPAEIPLEVCVAHTNPTNGAGQAIPPVYFRAPLGDQVNISAAFYSPLTQTLSVRAQSMDSVSPPTLEVGAFGDTAAAPLTNGSVVIPAVTAAPSKIRVLSSNGGSNEMQVSTTPPPATGVTLIPSLPSPQAVGTAVTFTAQGTGSFGYDYQFFFKAATAADYTMVQDYGDGSTWTLPAATPAGTYSIRVFVRTTPNVALDAQATANFTVRVLPATGVSLTANVPSPQVAGTPVVFTAAGQGSTGYQYQFLLRDPGSTTYTVVQPYSSTATWTMPITKGAGDYRLVVDVRTSNTVVRDVQGSMNYTLSVPAAAPATGVTVTANPASPQIVGTAVQFTAAGQGSTGYQYRFLLRDPGSTTYVVVQDYSSTATWTMPTTKGAGDYRLVVDVRTSNNVVRDAQGSINYTLSPPAVAPATGVTVTASPSSPQLAGTPVVFTAAGQGSTGYQYQFLLRDPGSTTYVVVQPYSSTATWTMPTTKGPGDYRLVVDVRTNNTVVRDVQGAILYTLN